MTCDKNTCNYCIISHFNNNCSRCFNPQFGVVAGQIGGICSKVNQVYPLSLLAFAATAKALSLPRYPPSSGPSILSHSPTTHHRDHQHQQITLNCTSYRIPASSLSGDRGSCSQVPGIEHRYRRHVKPKKQHEIKCLAEVGT